MANGDYGKFVFTRAWLFKDAFRRILIENDQKNLLIITVKTF